MKLKYPLSFILILTLLISMKVPSSKEKQKSVLISFAPVFKNQKLIYNDKVYTNYKNQKISFETLKFYVSKIRFLENNKVVYTEPNSFHLLDADNLKSMRINIAMPREINYDEVQFGLGVDSASNTGEMVGDLDPTKGMYWTWKAGYINFKLEGYRDGIESRKNEFQFHLGGYLSGENCYQEIKLDLKYKSTSDIRVCIMMNEFIDAIDFSKQHHIMSPGEEAVMLSKYWAKCFQLIQK